MWEKAKQYLHKMGGIILLASIVIWFMEYFPRTDSLMAKYDAEIERIEASDIPSDQKEELVIEQERLRNIEHQSNSYIGRIGRTIEPALKPLGFDWKMSVSLLTGMAAKEVVVSTLGILYTGDSDDTQALTERLVNDKSANGTCPFTPLVAFSFMLFVLIYFPCIATITAIVNESGSWKWGAFVIIYTCVLAWVLSFAVYQIGSLVSGLI
jgi:ferrous iron transport protein B